MPEQKLQFLIDEVDSMQTDPIYVCSDEDSEDTIYLIQA